MLGLERLEGQNYPVHILFVQKSEEEMVYEKKKQ